MNDTNVDLLVVLEKATYKLDLISDETNWICFQRRLTGYVFRGGCHDLFSDDTDWL